MMSTIPIASISIVTFLLIIEQSYIVMSMPVSGTCVNNCWAQYDLCVKIPDLTQAIQKQCVNKRGECIANSEMCKIRARLRDAVKILS